MYSNLYQDQPTAFTKADTARTPTYIRHPNGDFTSGTTLTFDSRPTGTNTNDFINANSFSSSTTDGSVQLARIFVDPLNQYPDEAINYSNNQATFRYVIGRPDLTIPNFQLTDSTGTVHTAFDIGQNIFPKITIANTGDATAISRDPADQHTYTWFYQDEPNPVATGTVGDTNVEMQNGEFADGAQFTYNCRPSPGTRCSAFINQQAWDVTTKGTYTARVFVNFDNNVIDMNRGNSQDTVVYSVGYTISGRIYVDMNKSGGYTNGVDMPLSNVTVTFTGPNDSGTAVTDVNGRYTSPALEPGTYTITTNTSTLNYSPLSTYPLSSVFTSRADLTGQDIRYFPKYTISGNIFNDINRDRSLNNGEVNYTQIPDISVTNLPANAPTPIVTPNSNGSYTIVGLINGQYRINYNNLPAGYIINNPVDGTPPYFDATVGIGGANCTVSPNSPDATCTSGSLNNLNYAIVAGQPWWQAYGLDVRFDNGLSNPIPPSDTVSATCGGGAYAAVPGTSTTPGVIFSGNATPDFWRGSASTTNWTVGTTSYPEVFPVNTLKTSYAYMQSVLSQSNITATNISTVCANLTNCTLPANLANGVYIANSSLTLNGYTFPANKNYVFLVNGVLTINGAIHVPTTSTATFFASNNLVVNANVGSTAACPAPAAASGDVEGFFSTDRSLIINSNSNCTATPAVPDKQLNVQGAIIINAAQTGGQFTNNRSLCTNNITYPTVTFRERPDMILNAPDLLHGSNYNYKEVAP